MVEAVPDKLKMVTEVRKEAESEVQEEWLAENKEKLKTKLREIKRAKLVVANLERERDDLLEEMEDKL